MGKANKLSSIHLIKSSELIKQIWQISPGKLLAKVLELLAKSMKTLDYNFGNGLRLVKTALVDNTIPLPKISKRFKINVH